jgi:WD40 repeat protein
VHTLKCYIPQHPADHHTAGITHVQYAPDGRLFGSASKDGSVKLYDPASGKAAHSYLGAHGGGAVNSVAFMRNGQYLLTAGMDAAVRLWDMRMVRGGSGLLVRLPSPSSSLRTCTHALGATSHRMRR